MSEIREQLSALMDGELPRDQVRFLLRRIDGDAQLAQAWARYQIAGGVLRRQAVVLPLREDFADSLMLRVGGECAGSNGSACVRTSGNGCASSAGRSRRCVAADAAGVRFCPTGKLGTGRFRRDRTAALPARKWRSRAGGNAWAVCAADESATVFAAAGSANRSAALTGSLSTSYFQTYAIQFSRNPMRSYTFHKLLILVTFLVSGSVRAELPDFATLVEKNAPAVVNVQATHTGNAPDPSGADSDFDSQD